MKTRQKTITGAEAIMGFLVWLSSRDTPITLSRKHSPSPAIELFDAFQQENPGIGTVREGVWPSCIIYPLNPEPGEHAEAPQGQE